MVKEGAKVGILGRTEAKLNEAISDLETIGAKAMGLKADVLNQEELELAKSEVLRKWGQIDILINCAGGNMKGATIMPDQNIFDLSISDFDRVTSLNLKGTLLPILVFGPEMTKQGKGSIINISSMAAQRPLTRVVGYAASKAAIDNLTKWLAIEMAQKFGAGLRVNALAPGFFVGEQNRKLLFDESGQLSARGQTIIDHTPMKRFGDPEDLCGAINWLSSDSSSFVTGTVISVDGGFGAFSGV